jgi:ABC-type polar amino acid transport system ATPase subunit
VDNTWLSIIPATITIAVAIWSKKVLPSLLLGLLVGSYLLNHSVIGGLETAIANAVNIISDQGNLQVLLFLYLFSGLIALVRKAGGITAFSALVGASGSGKTTVLRAIAGLDPVAAGRIVIEGSGDGGAPARATLVLQFHHLFAHLSALHNVWLAPVHVHGRARAEAEAQAQALLDRLGVGHRAAAMPDELSGGEAQRVAIARALAVDPPVLLMDEPTASLDAARRDELARTVRELAADGRTLLIASHDATFVEACAHRIVVMEGGRVQ